jgi:hypothetical protein
MKKVTLRVCRRCLVCEREAIVEEPDETLAIGPPCDECRAPTERTQILSRRMAPQPANPHAAALGRLGGLKGGPARARTLTAERRQQIARVAARARWTRPDGD